MISSKTSKTKKSQEYFIVQIFMSCTKKGFRSIICLRRLTKMIVIRNFWKKSLLSILYQPRFNFI